MFAARAERGCSRRFWCRSRGQFGFGLTSWLWWSGETPLGGEDWMAASAGAGALTFLLLPCGRDGHVAVGRYGALLVGHAGASSPVV